MPDDIMDLVEKVKQKTKEREQAIKDATAALEKEIGAATAALPDGLLVDQGIGGNLYLRAGKLILDVSASRTGSPAGTPQDKKNELTVAEAVERFNATAIRNSIRDALKEQIEKLNNKIKQSKGATKD